MLRQMFGCSVIVSALLLSGCGSSGGDSSEGETSTITGQFIDGAVEGLNYTCSPSGNTGVTNSEGEFTCNADDTIKFSVAGIELGSTNVATLITPLTLFPENSEAALNVAQLLQTLDSDGDAQNGIHLDTNTNALQALQTYFASEQYLDTDFAIDFTSSEFDTFMAGVLGDVLVDESSAHAHMSETIANYLGDPNEETPSQEDEEEPEEETPEPVQPQNPLQNTIPDFMVPSADIEIPDGMVFYFAKIIQQSGNTMNFYYDNVGDGEVDEVIFVTLDQYGNDTRAEYDRNNDGVIDRIDTQTYTYDASGNILTEVYDSSHDEYTERNTYTYDTNGNILTNLYESGQYADLTTYTYNANGEILIEENSRYGTDYYSYTYDENGNILTKTITNEEDGFSYVESFTYDNRGKIITESYESYDSDGVASLLEFYVYFYDIYGDLVQTIEYEKDYSSNSGRSLSPKSKKRASLKRSQNR